MDVCITDFLRTKGYKVTPQRLAIFNTLANTKEHPTAEIIFARLRHEHPTISLATVYKNLEILKSLGIIQILNTGEDCFRYDADTSIHPHVRCLTCGAVEDVHGINAKAFVDEVIAHSNYELCGQQFYFLGICPSCRQNKQTDHTVA